MPRCRIVLNLICWLFRLAAQGQGIGRSASGPDPVSGTPSQVAVCLRTLVRSDNFPMQSICASQGLERSRHSYQLYISDKPRRTLPDINHDHRARIIPVHTLTYSGYWLEAELSQVAIDMAQSLLRIDKLEARLWER